MHSPPGSRSSLGGYLRFTAALPAGSLGGLTPPGAVVIGRNLSVQPVQGALHLLHPGHHLIPLLHQDGTALASPWR